MPIHDKTKYEEKVAEAGNLYTNLQSVRAVSRKMGVSFKTASRWIVVGGMRTLSQSEATALHARKYTVNESFFKAWTPDMAYILGFIFAEGHITSGWRQLAIKQNDRGILEHIARTMEYTGPVVHQGQTPCLLITATSKALSGSLENLGICPGPKSASIKVPGGLQYPQHFVRGYFDGDGHGRWRGRYLRLGFTSLSREMLIGVLRIIPAKGCGPYLHRHSGCWSIEYNCKHAASLRDWMAPDESDMKLEWKWHKLYQGGNHGIV